MDPQKSKADQMASDIKNLAVAGATIRLWRTAGFAVALVVLAVVLLVLRLPWYIGTGLIAVAVAAVVLEAVTLRRTAAVNLSATPGAVAEEPEAGEFVELAIPAVMRYGTVRSVGVLGAGKVYTPENALLVTNRAVWVLTYPLAGADKVVGEGDIGKWQFLNAWQDILTGVTGLLNSQPLEAVLRHCAARRLCKREEIRQVKTLGATYAIRFLLTDGRTVGYSIRTKEVYEQAMAYFGVKR